MLLAYDKRKGVRMNKYEPLEQGKIKREFLEQETQKPKSQWWNPLATHKWYWYLFWLLAIGVVRAITIAISSL